jgi:uncharacterized protein (DUF433 family)
MAATPLQATSSYRDPDTQVMMADFVREIERIPCEAWPALLTLIQHFRAGLEQSSQSSEESLRQDFLSLSPGNEWSVTQLLMQVMEAHSRGIAKIPGVMGGEACIRGTRIPVWLLVSYRNQGMTDGDILKGYPDLSAADLCCVWGYSTACGDEIAAAIEDQQDVNFDLKDTR